MAGDNHKGRYGAIRAELLLEHAERAIADWITLAVAASIALTVTGSALAALNGAIPLWLAAIINFPAIYCCQIIAHEAVHATIVRRDHKLAWLNLLLGHAYAALLFWDFQTMRYLHLRHHRHTNDPRHDTDYLPPGISGAGRLLRSLVFLIHALTGAARHIFDTDQRPPNWRTIAISWTLTYALTVALIIAAPLKTLTLWVVPAIFATALIVLLHWSMHSREKNASVLRTTRIISTHGWVETLLRCLYLFQNHHLVHHLFPYVPFHRMPAVSRRLTPSNKRAGSRTRSATRATISVTTQV